MNMSTRARRGILQISVKLRNRDVWKSVVFLRLIGFHLAAAVIFLITEIRLLENASQLAQAYC